MKLLIDSREKSPELIDLVETVAIENGYAVETQQLDIGDFSWPSKGVVIEHKSTKDFLSSLTSGRLYSQLRDMNQFPHPYLFIEGPWDYKMMIGRNRLTQKAITGMICGVMYHFPGIQIFHWATQVMFAQAVISIRNRCDEEAPEIDLIKRVPSKTMFENPILSAYLSIPSIGKTKGLKLRDKYGNFREFLDSYSKNPEQFRAKGNTLPKKSLEYLDVICGNKD